MKREHGRVDPGTSRTRKVPAFWLKVDALNTVSDDVRTVRLASTSLVNGTTVVPAERSIP